jgi:hypothetical protein
LTRLEIISDPVCPWCYIGATHLFRALAARPEHPFAIRWRPYQLNPDMPEGGMDRKDYLAVKFGGAERAAKVYARVEAAAAEAGLEIDFGRIGRAPNTLDAHRVIHWAEADAGDFIFVPPYVPHQEINALAGEPLQCVVVRSDQEAVVVNLDITPAEEVEEVRWIDPNHPA